jgi:type II secretory pathway component GspD/PulD (secretin)
MAASASGAYGSTFGAAFGAAGPYGAPTYNTPSFSSNAPAITDPSLLVVRGPAREIALFQAFMERVDIPVPEVQLRVYVLEVRDSENRNSAVQLLLNLLSGQLTAQVGALPTETNRLFLGGRDISLAISRLTADSRVRLVSSPTLRAADGSTASVTIGTDTPTLGSIVTFSGAVQQSVSYQSAGVLLNVSPHILNDTIRLMIWQELSSFAKTETGLTTTPTKLRRAFRTDVVARNGEVLMLGGLSESTQINNRQRGLFGLGSSSNENSSSEIVVLLQVLRL